MMSSNSKPFVQILLTAPAKSDGGRSEPELRMRVVSHSSSSILWSSGPPATPRRPQSHGTQRPDHGRRSDQLGAEVRHLAQAAVDLAVAGRDGGDDGIEALENR